MIRWARAATAFVLSLVACRPAELVVRVDTDLRPGVDFDELRIDLQRGSGASSTPIDLRFSTAVSPSLPLELGVTPYDSADVPLNVSATALLAGIPVVTQSATGSFDMRAVHPIDLLLLQACDGFDTVCAQSSSVCAWGLCVASGAVPFLHEATSAPPDTLVPLPAWPSCPPAFASCTTTAGCESDLRLEDHCGSCDHVCSPGVGCDAPLCGDERAIAVAAGGFSTVAGGAPVEAHACAVVGNAASASRAMCWGSNDAGQLGSDPAPPTSGPVFVDLPGPVQAIAAGGRHTCAIVQTLPDVNQVYCWGNNAERELGDATSDANSSTPRLVVGSITPGPVMLAAGVAFTCAMGAETFTGSVSNAPVYCWGANDMHQTNPTSGGDISPTSTPTLVAVMNAAPGSLCAGDDFACVIDASNASNATCWGDVYVLGGLGSSAGDTSAQFALHSDAASLACGADFVCALTKGSAGRRHVTCFGQHASGQTANVYGDSGPQPALQIDSLDAIDPRAIAAAGHHACALGSLGKRCWGARTSGQLGVPDDGSGPVFLPVAPTDPMDTVQLAAGADFTCGARLSTGQIVCWGDDSMHQLGPGFASASSSLPVFVPPPGIAQSQR